LSMIAFSITVLRPMPIGGRPRAWWSAMDIADS
jgi:hypothetical protein